MPDNHPTSIRLDRSLKVELVKFAKAQGCSVTWLIADILRKWAAWKKAQEQKK